ncbi:Nitrogen permease reactivator protein [Ceratocystis pirilliformis]|uniref:non-specific serine/threonine protein kinase n=1 Tax=Ceratocystis pirilliformis TaxID=259994 RepID=A0ABR3ZC71_9PEZI
MTLEHEVAHIEIESTSTNASRQTTLIAHDDPSSQYYSSAQNQQHHHNHSYSPDLAVPLVPPVPTVPSVRIASHDLETIPTTVVSPAVDDTAPDSAAETDTTIATPPTVSAANTKNTIMPPVATNSFQATITPPPPMPSSNRTLAEVDPNIQQLSKSLKEANLQKHHRMAFEPIASLPASRVPSHESIPMSPSQRTLDSYGPGTRTSMASINSPPLTPSGTDADSGSLGMTKRHAAGSRDSIITPQPSSSQDASPRNHQHETSGTPKSSADNLPLNTAEDNLRQNNHRRGMFSLGNGASASSSRESSPSRAASYYSRPFTPGGDSKNPYAASKRAPQPPVTSNPKNIEPRFQFSRKKKLGSPCTSSTSLLSPDKRHHHKDDHGHGDVSSTPKSSMVDLKRFFKKAHHHHKRDKSPAPKQKAQSPLKTGHSAVPFGEDHGLVTKYGKFGKILGSGAGGSVRVMKRSDDNTVFAVKEFRARHTYESEKEYAKKLTGEFCIGSTLRHGNVIETLDIIQERGRWFVVMEYAPFDLFAIVMTGKMTRPEVSCCFLQILNGVTYLHSMGLAHRDLKLDNVVVSANGIMKIIDFGSAHVFSYPFEEGIIKAKGIVGSDPYLAPEVYDDKLYDPRTVDIWSLGIIYCCMTLRRFPWKVPRLSDNSYKLYASEPTPGHDPNKLLLPTSPTASTAGNESGDYFSSNHGKQHHHNHHNHHNHHHHHHHHHSEDASVPGTPRSTPASPGPRDSRHGAKSPSAVESTSQNPVTPAAQPAEKKEVIKGPWRILRLLPKESRMVIHGMLTIDPAKRMTMDQIIADDWVANTVICQQLPNAEVIRANDHTHTLEPPLPPAQPQPKPPQAK